MNNPSFLRINGLTKNFRRLPALQDVHLEIAQGGVLALLGPNGAGKSTLFGCLLGLIRPDAGRVFLRGRPLMDSDRRRFGYLPERVALYPHRTVRENGRFFCRLKGQPENELERQLKRVGLYAVQDRPVRQLSKGMLQRLGLAIALCGDPDLLILDEPFNGLDPVLLETLQRMIAEEQARGATLLISTHTISAIEPLAGWVAVLLEGRLAAFGSVEDLRVRTGELTLESVYYRIARTQSTENLQLNAAP